jgi:hypothetical protein
MDTAKHAARLFPLRPTLVLVASSLGALIAQVDTSVVTLAVGFLPGLRGALLLGGVAELAGSAIALAFVRAG